MSESAIIVGGDWLQERLGRPGVSVVDGAWYLPAQKRDARADYDAGHIPGAIFFDHDKVVEPGSTLPHALPRPETFARMAGAMGIAASDTIVVYDGPGLFSAPRVRWMFRTFGAKDVRILEGGLDRWKRDGRPLTTEATRIAPNVFDVAYDADRLATLKDVRDASDGRGQIADARPAGRFEGREPEPRPGLRGGHMPGARNVPSSTLSRDGALLAPDQLEAVLRDAGIDPRQPVVTTCGSGVSAATIGLALEVLGNEKVRLYDGSWAEWGGCDDTQVEIGPAGPTS